MTKTIIKDETGRIIEIQKEGKTVWSIENEINRSKISQESRNTQKQAIKDGDTQKRLENLEKIVFGKEIHNG